MKYSFQKNQKVVCINNESRHISAIKISEVYTINKKYKCPSCGSDQLILQESFYKINMICQCRHAEHRYQSYYEWRFKPYVVS